MLRRSAVISVTRCDEDIDILSELLEFSDNGFDEDSFLSDEIGLLPVSPRNPMLSEDVASNTVIPKEQQQPTSGGSDDMEPPVGTDSGESSFSQVDENAQTADSTTIFVAAVPKPKLCMSKNAVIARENRQKKKEHLDNLETATKSLKEENSELKCKVETQQNEIDDLSERVKYLENVLANQSTLSALLKNIQNTSGVKLKSSLSSKVKDGVKFNCSSSSGKGMENRENHHKSSLRKSKRKCVFECERLSPDNTAKRFCVNFENTLDKLQMEDDPASQLVESNTETEESVGFEMNNSRPKDQSGVCLHVSGEAVSLEFCALCCKMAHSNSVLDDHSYVRSFDHL